VQEWGDRYALIGPYNKASAAQEFEPIPPSQLVTEVLDDLKRKHGIIVYFGRWLVKGYPRVFLIDTNSSMHNLGKWRYELEAGFEVSQDFETNEAIVFGYQVATFLEELIKRTEDRPILAHFHEWYVLCNTFNFYSVHEVRSALKMQPIRCEYPYYINSYIQVGRRWFDRFKETSVASRDFVHHSRYFVGTIHGRWSRRSLQPHSTH
jgi:hypothetical protein